MSIMIRNLVELSSHSLSSKDSVLRHVAQDVEAFDKDLITLINDLTETMNHHHIAVGLAAPQIGVSLRVAIINPDKTRETPPTVIINPTDVEFSGKKDTKKESCMSVPNLRGDVERRSKVTFKYQDIHGESHSLRAEGFLARIFAHEIDHLNGFLYVDRMAATAKLEETDLWKEDNRH